MKRLNWTAHVHYQFKLVIVDVRPCFTEFFIVCSRLMPVHCTTDAGKQRQDVRQLTFLKGNTGLCWRVFTY